MSSQGEVDDALLAEGVGHSLLSGGREEVSVDGVPHGGGAG